MSVVVEQIGPLVLVEDLGREGYGALGISTSGAMDRGALRLANRLVGNPEHLAGLEVLLGGLRLRFAEDAVVAVTGAPVGVTLDGAPAPFLGPVHVRSGQVLALATPADGLRSYVAIQGGIDVAPVLGSRSTDPTTGMGPARVAAGDVLPIGAHPARVRLPADAPSAVRPTGDLVLHALWGPRDDWFTEAALAAFAAQQWEVTAEGDRVGLRLCGQPLERARDGELQSEGVVRGAVQVPRNGQPLVFLADHPTTGGYPVIAVVDDADVDLLAQARPGTRVRFAPVRREL